MCHFNTKGDFTFFYKGTSRSKSLRDEVTSDERVTFLSGLAKRLFSISYKKMSFSRKTVVLNNVKQMLLGNFETIGKNSDIET